jgi:hypothetical protein
MPIWGWVCAGLVVVAAGLVVLGTIDERKLRRHYAEHAERAIGWIVQANTALYTSGAEGKDRDRTGVSWGGSPAQILVAFGAGADEPDPYMAELAERVAALKGERPDDPDEVAVARLVDDEAYRPRERFRLPDGFTGGREVYSMHVWVDRALLFGGVLRHPFVRCLVFPDDPNARALMDAYRPADKDHEA